RGRVFARKSYTIPEAGRTAKGTNIVNLLELEQGESLTAMIAVDDDFSDAQTLLMVTRRGTIKRTNLSEFRPNRKGGKIALTLEDGDELLFVAQTDGTADVLIATKDGQAARFAEERVRVMGRTASGVMGIRLVGDDEVAGAAVLYRDASWNETHRLLTITEGGFGKRMEPSAFEPKGRAIQGVTCHNLTDKTGRLAGIGVVTDTDDVMMITESGSVIRTPAAGIPVYGRTAAGVIVMRVGADDSICNIAIAAQESDSDGAGSDAAGNGAEPGAEEKTEA
ncbi:MAG: DNA gyrase C-terminal beta-propeller domain-containing protein, partial [Eubacteriales bacterium]